MRTAFSKDKGYLIMDRDATFSRSFRACLKREGVKPVRLPPRSPTLNAHLERFFGSLKSACLHKLILFGETATRRAVRAFVTHDHTERNHQRLKNQLIVPMAHPPDTDKKIETTEHLGGLLRSYRRAAWLGRSSLALNHTGLKKPADIFCAASSFWHAFFCHHHPSGTRFCPKTRPHLMT